MGADSDIAASRLKAVHSAFSNPPVATVLIIAVAIATRIVAWWNPVAHVDDQFYLLAGEELLNGHWPYVDVWDRKPPGLFLLYAGIAWIGGGSILGLNIIATAFAAGTAILVRKIALNFAGATSATLSAFAYLLAMPVFGGQTGQSPVFYNLLIAGSAFLLIRDADQTRSALIRRDALVAMLLCGLAIIIKQISFVEGAYFGLAFLWLLHRRGESWAAMAVTGASMIAIALLPYALSLAGYALAGPSALNDFVYANFVSIFERGSWQPLAKIAGATYFLLFLLPLLGMGGWGAYHRWQASRHDERQLLLLGWLLASVIGYLSVPAFFDHYTLPVLVPICISAATAFERPSRWVLFAGLAGFYLLDSTVRDWRGNRDEAAKYELIRTTVGEARHGGCLYVADGPSRLYSDFPDCRPTRYLFPDHLVLITEASAIGADPVREIDHILAGRPAVIVMRKAPRGRRSLAVSNLLSRELRTHYRPVLILPDGYSQSVGGVTVWQRNDLALPGKH